MRKSKLLWVLFGITLLLPLASADTVGAFRAVTLGGPSGILVPLGFESSMSLAQARFWYNWICVITLLPVAAMASRRNHEQFALFIPVLAALLFGFGWLKTGNDISTLGAIIFGGFIGTSLYLKGQLRSTWGIGGPGGTVMNIVVFMILLSAVFGFVNSQAIWRENTGVQANQFLNVNLENEVSQMSNAGGTLDDLMNLGNVLLGAAIATLKTLLAIIACLVCFGGAVLLMYPWLTQSAYVIGILVVYQVGFYILLAKLYNDVFYTKSIYATEF
jgi:hypothetical protein